MIDQFLATEARDSRKGAAGAFHAVGFCIPFRNAARPPVRREWIALGKMRIRANVEKEGFRIARLIEHRVGLERIEATAVRGNYRYIAQAFVNVRCLCSSAIVMVGSSIAMDSSCLPTA